jgi:Domain of unknown function (DUF4276)
MKIGLAVDGQAETASFPSARDQLAAFCPNTILFPPVLVPMNAEVPAAAIAAECAARVGILLAKGIDLLIVLLDREQNQDCCGATATKIEAELAKIVQVPTAVVVKNRTFENWLLADLDALAASPGRFNVTSALRKRVQPNKADNVAALKEIKATIVKGSYNKVEDAKKILGKADPGKMRLHSRSFRRFLRLVGVAAYRQQSKNPA